MVEQLVYDGLEELEASAPALAIAGVSGDCERGAVAERSGAGLGLAELAEDVRARRDACPKCARRELAALLVTSGE